MDFLQNNFEENIDSAELKVDNKHLEHLGNEKNDESVTFINMREVVFVINNILCTAVEINNQHQQNQHLDPQINCPFHSSFIPKLTIEEYLQRILKYTEIEVSTLIIACIYINLYCKTKNCLLTSSNVYK